MLDTLIPVDIDARTLPIVPPPAMHPTDVSDSHSVPSLTDPPAPIRPVTPHSPIPLP